jgi:hypothetical protein
MSLERLLLDNNLFEGSIPQSLKNLKGLALLNLTMNKLAGSIPDALASMQSATTVSCTQQLVRFHPYSSTEFDIVGKIGFVLQ